MLYVRRKYSNISFTLKKSGTTKTLNEKQFIYEGFKETMYLKNL